MGNLYTFQKVFFALFQRFLQEFREPEKVHAFQEKAKLWVKERDGK